MIHDSLAVVETEYRLIRYVVADIREALCGMGLESDEGDWSATFQHESAVWPREWRWYAAYVVRGSNEGWYAHLDVVPGGVGRGGVYTAPNINIAVAKFWDRDLAFDYCKYTMHLLEGRR